jgi:ligand-binding sensor domain-containing protein
MKRGASGPSGFLFGSNNQNQIFRFNENAPSALWEEITPVKDTTITQYGILADPNGAVYLATTHGVQRSDDNGTTWHQKNRNLKDSIKKNLFDSSVVYLAIDGNGNLFAALQYGGIFRSSDKAETWVKLPTRDPDGPQINALAAAANGNIIIGNIERISSIGGKIYVSTDKELDFRLSTPRNNARDKK